MHSIIRSLPNLLKPAVDFQDHRKMINWPIVLSSIFGLAFGALLEELLSGKRKEASKYWLPFSPSCAGCVRFSSPCKNKLCNLNGLRKIRTVLRSSKRSLDVCICLITIEVLVDDMIEQHNKGVKLRIVIDTNQSQHGGGGDHAKERLTAAGISVKSILGPPNCLMHHKFTVVDEKFVIIGSMNWTKTAFSSNYENVEITDDVAAVKAFSSEFNNLWLK